MLADNGFVLGVDLGVKSVGLALIDPKGERIVELAVRVFPSGVEGDFESGRDSSRNEKRRQARLSRRQTERRARRRRKVFRRLQESALLPEGDAATTLQLLDQSLAKKYGPHPGAVYTLRAKALDAKLEPHELGRVFYHLAQRRGFLSNRRAPIQPDEEKDAKGATIGGLRAAIQSVGARTLGEYLAGLGTGQNAQAERIRGRRTFRALYQEEFEAIWSAQSEHHPDILTTELHSSLQEAIFFQRPLKDQSHLIGMCSLMPMERRAPLYDLDVQRWRILDRVNNLRLVEPDRKLEAGERNLLTEALSKVESLPYRRVRELLGLAKQSRFSIEAGGEKSIPGNATNARMSAALNLRWDQMKEGEQRALVALWAEAKDDEAFRQALEETGQYTATEVDALLRVRLPEDFAGFSVVAIRRLLPHLAVGMTTGEARKLEYPESFLAVEPKDTIPPVLEVLPELRNPAATRTLTELRKAVNEIIRKYGKPAEIRVELARDLKRNKKERQQLTQRTRERETKRLAARNALKEYDAARKWSRGDEMKYLLWQECEHTCPYSGRTISMKALFDEPRFDLEHIIPYSRSLDDSQENLTLCVAEYNSVKGNRTPWEAFHDTDEWDAMVDRVKKFGNRSKLRRFTMEETETAALLEKFTSNELNDTRYISKLAARYLGELYGGVVDAEGRRRVRSCSGQVTAILRRLWDLNRILSESPEKSRADHRHHAVDAATVAMVNEAMIQALARASEDAARGRQRRLRTFPEPWAGFREQLRREVLQQVEVSHRPERKLAGPLHDETLYGRPHEAGSRHYVHIRKPVHGLSTSEIENIIDPTVRERVQIQLGLVGGSTAALERDPPLMASGTPIRRVRIRQVARTVTVGTGRRQRHVIPNDNHHMAVFAVRKGEDTKYYGQVVTRLEAVRRHRAGLPVVQREGAPNEEFLFSLSEGDMVTYKGELWRVRGVATESNGRLELSRARDARKKEEIKKDGGLERPSANVFCSQGGRKVTVSPLGEMRDAHD